MKGTRGEEIDVLSWKRERVASEMSVRRSAALTVEYVAVIRSRGPGSVG